MRITLFVVLFCLLLPACKTFGDRQREDLFETTSSQYGSAIRWADFNAARSFQKTADNQSLSQSLPAKNLRVTRYAVQQISGNENGQNIVLVSIDYYLDDSLKVKNLLDRQVWEYQEAQHAWKIVTPLPDFR